MKKDVIEIYSKLWDRLELKKFFETVSANDALVISAAEYFRVNYNRALKESKENAPRCMKHAFNFIQLAGYSKFDTFKADLVYFDIIFHLLKDRQGEVNEMIKKCLRRA